MCCLMVLMYYVGRYCDDVCGLCLYRQDVPLNGKLFLECIKVFFFFNALVNQKHWWKVKRCYLLGVVLLTQVQILMCVSSLCKVLSDVLVMMIVSCI